LRHIIFRFFPAYGFGITAAEFADQISQPTESAQIAGSRTIKQVVILCSLIRRRYREGPRSRSKAWEPLKKRLDQRRPFIHPAEIVFLPAISPVSLMTAPEWSSRAGIESSCAEFVPRGEIMRSRPESADLKRPLISTRHFV